MDAKVVSIASAPGKVILFGEHAVVYGTTAISAALSDLRIYVSIESSAGLDQIEVYLHDLKTPGEEAPAPWVVSYGLLSKLCGACERTTLTMAENPTETDLMPMRQEFVGMSLQASQGLMAICFLVSRLAPELVKDRVGLCINVKSIGLPIGAGLGSSAAFSVALSAALMQLRQKLFADVVEGDQASVGAAAVCKTNGDKTSPETIFKMGATHTLYSHTPPPSVLTAINAWAYAAEVVIHGAPSGLDNTTSCFGGALKYDRNSGKFETMAKLPDIQILLTNTKVPRSTKQLVAGVRALHDKVPKVVKPIFDSIEGISQRFLEILAEGAARSNEELVEEIGTLFRINQDLLNAIGVGHAALTAVASTSQEQDFPCKLTGAGGGGCAITLLRNDPGSQAKVDLLKERLSELGFETFHSAIAGDGVKWH